MIKPNNAKIYILHGLSLEKILRKDDKWCKKKRRSLLCHWWINMIITCECFPVKFVL